MNNQPIIYSNPKQPEWGYGVVLEERGDKLELHFEKGGPRVFRSASNILERVELPRAEAKALDVSLRGRRAPSRSATPRAPAKPKVRLFADFEVQLAWFRERFPGGFTGEAYLAEERGGGEIKKKAAHKQPGIELVQETLSAERFASASPEDLFEAIRQALSIAQIVHPHEGPLAFGLIPEETRPQVVEAFRNLLHGDAPYGERLDALTAGVPLFDKDDKPKAMTWPTATLLGALFRPEEHIAVKPTYFSSHAPLVELQLPRSQPVTGENYASYLEVAKATQERLIAAGEVPRDLMDVYAFIWRSHSEAAKKKPALKAAAPVEAVAAA